MDIVYKIMEIVFILLDSFYVMYLTTKLYEMKSIKYKKIWTGMFFCVLNILSYIIDIFPKQESIITLLSLGVAVAYSVVCLNGQLYLRIITPILLFITLGIVSGLGMLLFPLLTNTPMKVVQVHGSMERVSYVMISKLFLFILGLGIYFVLKRKKIELSKREWIVIVVVISAMCIEIFGNTLILKDSNLTSANQILILIMIVLVIVISILIYHLVMRISTYNKQLLEESMIRLQLEEKSKNILDIEKYYKDLKILEHDVKHHYTIINTMLLDNNVDEAKKYMKNLMEKNIAVTNMPIVVNSSMINAILSSKFSECKDKDIECKARVTGDISKDMEMDICIILANIIDNAIKASEKEDEPYIGLEMYREKNYLNIIVENKISESVLHANPKLTTSKKDKKKHGLGLLSVKSTVERYGGMLDCYERDNKFVVKVVLKAD